MYPADAQDRGPGDGICVRSVPCQGPSTGCRDPRLQVPDQWDTAEAALQITLVQLQVPPHLEGVHRVEGGGAKGILFEEPDLIPAQQIQVHQVRVVGSEYELAALILAAAGEK